MSFNKKVYFSDNTSLEHKEFGEDSDETQSSPVLKRTSQEAEIVDLEPPTKKSKQDSVGSKAPFRSPSVKEKESDPPLKEIIPPSLYLQKK